MKKYLIKLKSLFVKSPEKEFTWTVEDFEAAKKWAKSNPDPDDPSRTIWERAYASNWNESAYILAEINKFIKNKTKDKTTV
jgi:hypothetical protein